MRVRLMSKLSVQHKLMQDAVGVVVDFEFHEEEFGRESQDDWRYNSGTMPGSVVMFI